MQYIKPFLSVSDQVDLLKRRGLIIDDRITASSFLSTVSYYRFSSYTLVFEECNTSERSHQFKPNTNFSDIVNIYNFDHKLRIHTLKAVESIEIAFRTKVCYYMAEKYGSHWYENHSYFYDQSKHRQFLELVDSEISRSRERFIEHYQANYRSPQRPPSWMIIELLSLGAISKLFQNIRDLQVKKDVARSFGLRAPQVLENWIRTIAVCRNLCAHHARIWNRRFSPISIPRRLRNQIQISYLYRDYVFSIRQILSSIHSDVSWGMELKQLLAESDFVDKCAMGFIEDWENDVVWTI